MERRWKILLITSVGLFMASLDLFIVNLAFPYISKDYPGTPVSSPWRGACSMTARP